MPCPGLAGGSDQAVAKLKNKNLTDSSNVLPPTNPSDLDATNAPAAGQCVTKAGGDQFTWAACGGGSVNTFSTIDAPAGSDPVADSTADTLGFVKGRGIDVVGNSSNDTLTVAADPELYTETRSAYLRSPTIDQDGIVQFTFPTAIKITRVWCSTKTGTVDISLDARTEATPNTPGPTVVSSLTCDTNSAVVDLSGNPFAIAARDPLNLDILSISGPPQPSRGPHPRRVHEGRLRQDLKESCGR